MPAWKLITKSETDSHFIPRSGEIKLGEVIQVSTQPTIEEAIAASSARIVLLGIPEDIGVRANMGTGGAHTLWPAFLKAFLSVQNDPMLQAENVLLLAWLNCTDLTAKDQQKESLNSLRDAVVQIDNSVFPVVRLIAAAGKIPVIIGGGHNNAYPVLKGMSLGLHLPVNTINTDAHSDFRTAEGRHSGNGFRYAVQDGLLGRYAMVGLHRNYNNPEILQYFTQHPQKFSVSFFEDIFLEEKQSFQEAVQEALSFTEGAPAGIELDMDCMAGVLSSAMTPSGISTLQARQFVHQVASARLPAYFHLCEGAAVRADGLRDGNTGKLAAYLVTDFLRAVFAQL